MANEDGIRDHYVVDGHFDLLSIVDVKRDLGCRKVIDREMLPGFIEGGVDVVVSSIYVENEFLPEMGLKKALDQISTLHAEIDESPGKIMLCRTYEDILKAKISGKLGVMLSLEGVDPLTNDLKLLRIFYELGVRMVGLAWSRRNYAADGCHFSGMVEGKKGGLTNFGVELIKEAEKLNMLIDVSHLNDEGFWDVMEFAKKPVIASHSNCRILANVMRNLSDEQITAIAKNGGVIGMNACSSFVSDSDECSDMEHLADHVDHIVNIAGIEHVGFGFDFCDILRKMNGEKFVPLPRKNFDVLNGHESIGQFIELLLRRGYSDEDVKLISGGNFMNLYKKFL